MFYKRILTNIELLIAAVFLLSACSDSGTGPNSNKSVRDYTWTADTLTNGASQTLMSSIWAASSNDIYICGHNSRNSGFLWHYDGVEWTDVNIFSSIELGPVELNDVVGISTNNIWIVGSRDKTNRHPPPNFLHSSFIAQYDGFNWIEHEVNSNSQIFDVYANTPNDVWACGDDGIVYHFDGNNWDIDTIKVQLDNNEDFFQLKSIVVNNNTPFMLGIKVIQNGVKLVDYFFESKNDSWTIVDSFLTDNQHLTQKWGGLGLYNSSTGKLYSYGIGGIFEWNNNAWLNTFQVSGSIGGMGDTGENNILTAGSSAQIYHYDGSNWKQLLTNYGNENNLFTGVWLGEKEAFIIGNDFSGYPQTTIVLHGK